MPPEAIQPFPWRSLEAIPGSSVFALRDVRRWAERQVRPGAFARALTDLIGADVELLVRRATPRAAGPAVAGGVGLLLGSERAIEGEAGSSGAALLEVEAAMALAVVSRVIRRPLPTVIDRGAERAAVGSGALAGAFAAIVVAAARRAHAVENPRVVAAGSAEELEARFVRDGRERIALSLTVLVGDEAYAARLVVAHDDARFAPSPDWTLRALASLGATPLSIPLVACASTATLAEIAALRQGDAWIPGTWTLGVGVGAGQALLRGDVLLAAPCASTGVRARLVDDGRLVLSGEVDAVCAGAGDQGTMTESSGKDGLLNALGDVPVIVRVEIGEARMAAREWATLGRGDVVTLGRRVGESVVLRVGGVPVARGELVNVDGEVGVRIAERLGEGPTESATET